MEWLAVPDRYTAGAPYYGAPSSSKGLQWQTHLLRLMKSAAARANQAVQMAISNGQRQRPTAQFQHHPAARRRQTVRSFQAVSIFSTATPVIMGSDPWPKARIGRGEIRTISDLKFRSSVQTHHAQGQRSSDRPIKAASAANTNLGGGRFWHASAEAIFNPTSSSNSCVSRSITAQQRHHHLIAARIFQKSHSRPNITILSDHGKMGSRKSEAHLLNSVSASHGVRVSVKHGETAATQSNSNTEHTSRILILAIRPGHPKLRSKPSNT
ncbi:hypothetical protein ACLOJK_007644 [Asimina triloba]